MLSLRPSSKRGYADHGWLKAAHTFSFADFHDPDHMGFKSLRVINEDRVAAGAGFPMHSHRDMEIITYIISGSLEHRDSMGNSAVIRPGEVQRMSAGTGVRHSEFNPSKTEITHLLQIWILPERDGINPSYEQKSFLEHFSKESLTLVASPNGEKGSVSVNQSVKLYVGHLKTGEALDFDISKDRHLWIQMVKGAMQVSCRDSQVTLKVSDGLAVSDESAIQIKAVEGSEFLLFDLN
jgi:redox-sensitive bicupin YhaK (pirin superfamily)